MIKVKILPLLLSVILFFFSAVPASAAEEVNSINILDFSTPNDSGSYQVSLTSTNNVIQFSFPTGLIAYYVDIVFYAYAGSGLTGVSATTLAGTNLNLSLDTIANAVYRLHGSVNGRILEGLKLLFYSSGNITVQFLSFKIQNFRETVFAESGSCVIGSPLFSGTISYRPTDSTNRRIFESTDDPGYSHVWLTLTWDDWKLYDSLSFTIYYTGTDVLSISAKYGSDVIPIMHSFINSSGLARNSFIISGTISLNDIDKRSDNIPTVEIYCSNVVGNTCTVDIVSMSGSISSFDVNPVVYWLQSLNLNVDLWFDTISYQMIDLIDAVRGNSSLADDFNDQSSEKNEQLQDMVGVMDSVQRPDINTLNPSLTISNAGADIVGGIGPVLTVPMQNPIILQVLILSLTFAMIAYVLYGKR